VPATAPAGLEELRKAAVPLLRSVTGIVANINWNHGFGSFGRPSARPTSHIPHYGCNNPLGDIRYAVILAPVILTYPLVFELLSGDANGRFLEPARGPARELPCTQVGGSVGVTKDRRLFCALDGIGVGFELTLPTTHRFAMKSVAAELSRTIDRYGRTRGRPVQS